MSAAAPRADLPRAAARRRTLVDVVAVALLLAVPVIGFAPTFAGPGFAVAGFGGLAAGMGLAVLGARLRWGVLTLTAATAALYFVLGGALALPHTTLAGVVPTIETWRPLAVGIVTSWKQLLTTVAPVASGDGHLIVPFLLALVASVLTAGLALRVRPPAWALVPALAFLGVEIALGMSQPALPVVQGIVFAVVAVAWLALRQAWDPARTVVEVGAPDALPVPGQGIRRLVAGAAILGVAAAAGVATAAIAAPAGPRYVLRDVVIPPFDIRQYPSPLQSFRGYVRDSADETLFTVTGLPDDARVRLAVMDAYNGMVYNVSDEGAGSSSAFTPVRENMSPDAEGQTMTLRFEIDELDGVWLPDAGAVTEVRFDGERADDLRRAAHYNDATGTAVVTAGLAQGDAYTMTTVFAASPSDEALADVGFAPVRMPEQREAPEGLAEAATDAMAEAVTPIERVRALESWLAQDGFFSHGLEGEALSPAGHGAARVTTLLGSDQMIGDDEQYAVAMSLIAAELGIPARVVMGFHADEEDPAGQVFTATGADLHAWVEVAFEGYGWLPFDPTPPEDQVPNDQTTKPKADPRPQVLQPPPPPQEPVELPPTVADDRESEEDQEAGAGWIVTVLLIAGGVLAVLAVLLAPFIAILLLKAARRRRRRAAPAVADRISGGWDELVDRAVDLRAPLAAGATRAESAPVVGSSLGQPAVTALAARADAEVFGPGEPSPERVDDFWREIDAVLAGSDAGLGRWARLRARVSLRSLLMRARLGEVRASIAQRATQIARDARDAAPARRGARPAAADTGHDAARAEEDPR
ncbi:MAG: transglutaminase [Microbacterium sp.]|uniref:transglutaminase-like domain-containing protein n=1 Tax=Microbacterium sp. TaxID=51671 RepID=UPI000DB64687|nr:transglutaminase-like domain-containing protein [Microbacterium sp.]PZU41018.1 MAG: transglutaminase [Microbacterium sp.]